jgi:hypothetical protein
VDDLVNIDYNDPYFNKQIFDIYTINNEYTLMVGNLKYNYISYTNYMRVY